MPPTEFSEHTMLLAMSTGAGSLKECLLNVSPTEVSDHTGSVTLDV